VVATAFLAAQNTLAVSSAGELFQLDQTSTVAGFYVRKFKANSSVLTADGNFLLPAASWSAPMAISYDDTTSTVDIVGVFFDVNGNSVGGITRPSGQPLGTATKNGYGGTTQPGNNYFLGYSTSHNFSTPNPITMGSQPSSLAVGTIGTETQALVLSRNGAVTLWRWSLSGSSPEASVPLAGITPSSTVQAANPTAGGWQVAYANTGPSAGTVTVLSTPDNYVTVANATTMQTGKNATLTAGIWNQIASDNVHGTFILASANPQTASTQGSTTTFVSVNPSTGVVTPLTSKSTLLAAGFAVSADGNWLYICSRSACETQPNQ
jgi:hypothetical protein